MLKTIKNGISNLNTKHLTKTNGKLVSVLTEALSSINISQLFSDRQKISQGSTASSNYTPEFLN